MRSNLLHSTLVLLKSVLVLCPEMHHMGFALLICVDRLGLINEHLTILTSIGKVDDVGLLGLRRLKPCVVVPCCVYEWRSALCRLATLVPPRQGNPMGGELCL